MGLFEFIGEAIGNACSAIAEFIGDVLETVLKGLGNAAIGVSKDMYKDVGNEADDPNSPLRADAEKLQKQGTEPIEKGWLHSLEKAEDRHSEIPIERINETVLDLWETIRRDSGAATLGAIVAECASLGQVDGVMTSYQIADRISGASSFASKIQEMRLNTEFLTMYQRHLNQANPMMLPGPTDLVRFGLREVWDSTRRPELLAEQAPSLYYKFMGESGFNFDRAADYWASHF